MAAITLTPIDNTTAPVVVNSEIIYHVFTINGVTRVLYGKGGKSPYQVDVQESAASIAAASPNLVEVITVNGLEYLFIGSGGTGDGKGIMFIEADGAGSKITFKYTEESNNTLFYSYDSPSVLADKINALTPSIASSSVLTKTVVINNIQLQTLYTKPITLIDGKIHKSIGIVSVIYKFYMGSNPILQPILIGCLDAVNSGTVPFSLNQSSLVPFASGEYFAASYLNGGNQPYATAGQSVLLTQNADEPLVDSQIEVTVAYYYA